MNIRLFSLASAVATVVAAPLYLSAQEAVEHTSSDAITAEPTAIPQRSPKHRPADDAASTSESSAKSASVAERARRLNMTPEQFTSAGLDKLSPDQLANLERSMKGQATGPDTSTRKAEAEARKAEADARRAQADAQRAQAQKPARKVSVDEVASRVDGQLDRLTGHSIIRLEDGTMWKQVNADDRYPAPVKDHPTAYVNHSSFGYKMRISGIPEFYVNPVRN